VPGISEKKGFEKITVGNRDEDSINMLARGRVDLIPFAELSFVQKVRAMGYAPSDFEKAYFFEGTFRRTLYGFQQKHSG